MVKKVLFVTYGGGHARMCVPVIKQLEADSDIKCEIMALTQGGQIMLSEGYDYLSFKDFLRDEDKEARAIGEKLAKQFHNHDSGIPYAETIAYLGLSYWDMIQRIGEEEAEKQWQTLGMNAFNPKLVFERVMRELQPDMVVVTNSPRSERAAVEIANKYSIATLCMVDLFGTSHLYTISAQHITVLCENTIKNLQSMGVERPREVFYVTGNPAFDKIFDYRGDIDLAFRKQHFPSIPVKKKMILWVDGKAYYNLDIKEMYIRTDDDIINTLDGLAEAAKKADAHLLIRPHPSQPKGLFHKWIKNRNQPFIHYAGEMPLYPLLKACDIVTSFSSTVMLEALLMNRKVVQLRYYEELSDFPLAKWGWCWLADDLDDLNRCFQEAFNNEKKAQQMFSQIQKNLPQELAAPKISQLIRKILSENVIQDHV